MNALEMKVMPSFQEGSCSILFSFYFQEEEKKIGEAVICTCSEAFFTDGNQTEMEMSLAFMSENIHCEKKIAYLKEFQVMDEYKQDSMGRIQDFLRIIGISEFKEPYVL